MSSKQRRFLEAISTDPPSRDVVPLRTPDKTNQPKVTPSTSRALTLRNGKHGSMGTGEIALLRKMSGREKLDLLAEDKMKSALRAPFQLEKAQKIAQARMDVYLDDITNHQDPQFCFHLMERELRAHVPQRREPGQPDPMHNPSWVAEHFGAHIHNTYMLASAWKIVLQSLRKLDKMGLHESHIRDQLRNSEAMRTLYLVVYDMVKNLVQIGQIRLRMIAQNTPHYAPFFKINKEANPQTLQVQFDWDELKAVYKSFVDSVVIELCLPGSAFPLPVLFSCLQDSATESPADMKRFPQAMWDAVGDLSDAVQLLDLLETPLLTPQGEVWRRAVPTIPVEFGEWEDAQILSAEASRQVANYRNMVCPLSNTTSQETLSKIWSCIKSNYTRFCGYDPDALWHLTEVRKQTPKKWMTYAVLENRLEPVLEQNSDDDMPGLALVKRGRFSTAKKVRPAITANGESDSDEPPALVDESDSDTTSDDDASDVGGVNEGPGPYDKQSEYDTDEEEYIHEMAKEAWNAIDGDPENLSVLENGDAGAGVDAYAEERKKNPFLKLLKALKGRMSSSSATIMTNDPDAPRQLRLTAKSAQSDRAAGATATKSSTKPKAGTQRIGDSDDDLPDLEPIYPQAFAGSTKATVEDAEDEEASKTSKKKKKKKPKKKKSAASVEMAPRSPMSELPLTPTSPTPQLSLATPVTASSDKTSNKRSPQTPTQKAPSINSISTRSPSIASPTSTSYASNVSLPLPHEQNAQSARSYLQSHPNESKTKIKSRPDHIPSLPDKKASFLSKIGSKMKDKAASSEGKPKKSLFARLRKSTANSLRKIIGNSPEDKKGSLKWEQFLQVMRDLGFDYDPSTAGSSVRFDPRDPKFPPITFHKPHPDPTLHPIMLREFGKRLKEKYGWTEEELLHGFNKPDLGPIDGGSDDE